MEQHLWDLGNFKVLVSLKKEGVNFLVTGGCAVNFYVNTRIPNDLDILIDNKIENIQKIICAFSSLVDFAPQIDEITRALYSMHEKSESNRRLTCSPSPTESGVMYYFDILFLQYQNFKELWNKSVSGLIYKALTVQFVSKEDLIEIKKETTKSCQETTAASWEESKILLDKKQQHLADIEILEKNTIKSEKIMGD